MSNQTENKQIGNKTVELATFYVGDSLCGMDILKVQEINKLLEMTEVPLAPDYVKGILNLRGQIVTVIDLGSKLNLADTDTGSDTRNIIVNSNGEYIGLLVDRIGDVERTEEEKGDSSDSGLPEAVPQPADIRSAGSCGYFHRG